MPRTSDLKKFKQELRALAHENEIREEWNEPYEDVPLPVKGLEADLSELLEAPAKRPPTPDALFSDLPLEPGSGSEPAFDDGFLLPDSLGEGLEGLDHYADLERPPAREESGGMEYAAAPEATEVPSGEDILAGLGDLGGFADAAPADEPESLVDFGKDATDFDASFGEAGEGITDTDVSAAVQGDEFAIPEDFSEGTPTRGLADEEAGGFDLSAFAQGQQETESAEELPGIADFDAGGLPEAAAFGDAADTDSGPGGAETFSLPDLGATEEGFSLGGETTMGFESAPAEEIPDFGGKPVFDDVEDFGEPLPDAESHDTFSLEGAFSDSDFSGGFVPPNTSSQGESAFDTPRKPGKDTSPANARYSESEIDALQDTLLSYPLNLRLAIEGIIAEEKGEEEQQAKLVRLLVDRSTAQTAADLASRILKKPIEIPKGFEKRTGAAFEARKGTFAYAFVHNILPLLEIVAACAVGLALVGLLVWNLVVLPLQAEAMYNQGIEYIATDRFAEAKEAFKKAKAIRVVRD